MKTETGFEVSEYDWLLFSVDPVILTIKDNQLQVLLVHRSKEPQKGKWALPGGRVDRFQHKSLGDAVREKLYSKTGLNQSYFEQVYTEGADRMDERGWSVTTVYMALVNYEAVELESNITGEPVAWFEIDKLDGIELAFWHRKLIENTLSRLRSKILYSDLPMHFMPEMFTISELRQAYELTLNKKLAPSPFRRRLMQADILEETGSIKDDMSNRPAALYKYKFKNEIHVFKGMLKDN